MHTTSTRFRIGRVAIAVATFLPLILASPGSVSANQSGGSEATITIEGGALTISVPSVTADLGTFINLVDGGSVTGNLGEVKVSDARSGATGWSATAISTTFTSGDLTAIAASLISYAVGDVTASGLATFEANDLANMTGAATVITATATGDNSAAWNPEITVDVPGGTAAGTYTATINHALT